MPRNPSGAYVLPDSNPVSVRQPIAVAWANPTFEDLALQLNELVTRDGLLAMTDSFLLPNGTGAAPILAFKTARGTGFYWKQLGVVALVRAGVEGQTWASVIKVPKTLNISGHLFKNGVPQVYPFFPFCDAWDCRGFGPSVPLTGQLWLVAGGTTWGTVTMMRSSTTTLTNRKFPMTRMLAGDVIELRFFSTNILNMRRFKVLGPGSNSGTYSQFNVSYIGLNAGDGIDSGSCYLAWFPQRI